MLRNLIRRLGITVGVFILIPSAAAQAVTIVQPNGGETLAAGSTYTITWTAGSGSPTRFDLFATTDNGMSWQKLNKTGKLLTSPYDWSVPAVTKNKTKCKVRVVEYDEAGTRRLGADLSDGTFTIGALDVTAPNGGETLVAGTIVSITWHTITEAPAPKAAIYYTLDGGNSWRPVGVADNHGSYTWTVPQVAATGRGKIRVDLRTLSAVRVATDASNETFTIERVSAGNQDLNGDYSVGALLGSGPGPAITAIAALLDLSADGSGGSGYAPVLDSSGTIASGTAPYQVALDGQLDVEVAGQTLHGVLSRSGDIFLLADTTDGGGDVGSFLAIRRSTGMTTAALEGTYIAAGIGQVLSARRGLMSLAEITMDAQGTGMVHCLFTNVIQGCPDDKPITVTVSPDGTLTTVNPQSGGAVSPDGKVMMIVEADSSSDFVQMIVGMKKSAASPSAGVFTGKFIMANLDIEPSDAIASLFRVKPDGATHVAYRELYTSSGSLQTGGGEFHFDPATGLLEINGSIKGILLDDGQAFLALETDTPSGSANLSIGLKTTQ